MGLVDFLTRKPKPYQMRKKYDKVRLKVDRVPRIEKRIELLKMLDQIEPQVTSMEEHHMSNFDLKKTAGYVNFSLKRVEFLVREEKAKQKDVQKKRV